jgi:hypothetical protein
LQDGRSVAVSPIRGRWRRSPCDERVHGGDLGDHGVCDLRLAFILEILRQENIRMQCALTDLSARTGDGEEQRKEDGEKRHGTL